MYIEREHLDEVKRILGFWAAGVPVYAFGSRVHGRTLKRTSDLDICFRGDTPVSEKVKRQVANAFEVSDIPFRVDVVDWHDLSAEFRAAIVDDLVPVACAVAERAILPA